MCPNANNDPGRPLLSILPRWMLIALTVAAFALTAGGLLLGIFRAELFEHPIARFCLCATIAAYFSVFLFVLYPQTVKISAIPGIKLPVGVKLVGPVALFIVLLLILLQWMPIAAPGRFFRADYAPGQDLVHVDNFYVTAIGEAVEPSIVVDKAHFVKGIYVKFSNNHDQYQAQITVDYRPPLTCDFERGLGDGSFRIPQSKN